MSRLLVTAISVALVGIFPLESIAKRATLTRLADNLVQGAEPSLRDIAARAGSLGWAFRYETPQIAGARDRVEGTLRQLFADRLGAMAGFRRVTQVASPPGAELEDLRDDARNQGADYLLVLDVFERTNHLHVVGELLWVPLTFWSRVRRPVSGIRSHFYAAVRIDAELRTLLDARASSTPREFQLSSAPEAYAANGPLVAMVVGDLDGDGLQETVGLGEKSLWVWRQVSTGSPELVRHFSFEGYPRAERPSRELLGYMQLVDLDQDGREEVAFWNSELASGHLVKWSEEGLEPVRVTQGGRACGRSQRPRTPLRLCGVPLGRTGDGADSEPELWLGHVQLGRHDFQPRISRWRMGLSGQSQAVSGLYSAWTRFELHEVTPGTSTNYFATVDAEGALRVRSEQGSWLLPKSGLAVVFTDLNDDGVAELIRTAASWPGERDRLYVHSLSQTGSAPILWEHPVPAVHALAVGDANNDGQLEIVVLADDRFHLIREERNERHDG